MVLGGHSYDSLWLTLPQTTLTIAPGFTVRGQSGSISSAPYLGGPSSVSVVNQGSILVDEPGGSVTIGGTNFENEGVVEVVDGAGLQPTALSVTNAGTIRIDRAAVTFFGNYFQTNGIVDFGLGGPGSQRSNHFQANRRSRWHAGSPS